MKRSGIAEEFEQFSDINTFDFTIQDVVREFQETNRFHLARILVNVIETGILCKIYRDTQIRNFSNLNIFDY